MVSNSGYKVATIGLRWVEATVQLPASFNLPVVT